MDSSERTGVPAPYEELVELFEEQWKLYLTLIDSLEQHVGPRILPEP